MTGKRPSDSFAPPADMPSFETIKVSLDPPASGATEFGGTLGRLTLNQPHKLNPLGLVPLREIAEAAHWFDEAGTSVVIVTGAGDRAFSAGFDLDDFANTGAGGEGRSGGELGRRMAEAVERMEATTIAAVHGHCVGGGLVLAAVCDLRIAADNTRFSIPEIDLGIPLAWGGIPRLVREIGPAMTRELVMTCRPFDAHEAKAAGFLNRVVARDQLDAEVDDLAQTLCQKAPALIRTTKRQVNDAIDAMIGTDSGWTGEAHIAAANADPGARAAARRYMDSMKRR